MSESNATAAGRHNLTTSSKTLTDLPPWIQDAKAVVRDLVTPNPSIYWTDFFLSIAIGYPAAIAYLGMEGFSWLRIACFLVGTFAIFRASSFVHELIHLRDNRFHAFHIGWDMLCGIPLLFPSFAYIHHLDHHRCDSYGTREDGEYLPFGVDPPRTIGYFFVLTFIWPLLVVFRFLLLTPLSFLYPPFRHWLLTRFSSFGVVNFQYRLEVSKNAPLKYWAFLDLACFARTVCPLVMIAAGALPWSRLLLLYSIAAAILTLNFIRALCLHHFLSEGEPQSYLGQLQDSITLPHNGAFTELFIPVGLRYHALHHMFPHLPYHALGSAHRRLMQELPADSDYHRTVAPGMGTLFARFWKTSWSRARN